MFPPRAECVDSFSLQPSIGDRHSQTLTGGSPTPVEALAIPHRPDDVNLAPSGTADGNSENAASILAVDSPDIRSSDSGVEVADPAAIAPVALTSRRGFLMNTMVSAASLATATALPITSPSIAVDPVFAVIERHKALSTAYDVAVNHPDVGDDSPEFAAVNEISNHAGGEMIDHADIMFAFRPTTSAGVEALLGYISTLEDWQMPRGLTEPSEIEALKNLCGSLSIALAMSSGAQAIGEAARVSSAIGGSSVDPIFAAIEAHRSAADAHGKACEARRIVHRIDDARYAVAADIVALRKCGADLSRLDQLEAARDHAGELERDRVWDMIWTAPTTANGLAALLRYCRENESINELVSNDEWEDVLEWTMESAACALAGLPEPPMGEVVAAAWEGRTDDESELETA
jgi:hypothetical protein